MTATIAREETLEEKKTRMADAVAYKFRDENKLTEEQLTDPDYRLKQLAGLGTSVCSKCHHCR